MICRAEINDADFESELQFYRQSVFFPVMHLCKTIAATLGTKSHSARVQVGVGVCLVYVVLLGRC